MDDKCPFCGGRYMPKSYGWACLMCDRTADIPHELMVQAEQKKDHVMNIYYERKKRKVF